MNKRVFIVLLGVMSVLNSSIMSMENGLQEGPLVKYVKYIPGSDALCPLLRVEDLNLIFFEAQGLPARIHGVVSGRKMPKVNLGCDLNEVEKTVAIRSYDFSEGFSSRYLQTEISSRVIEFLRSNSGALYECINKIAPSKHIFGRAVIVQAEGEMKSFLALGDAVELVFLNGVEPVKKLIAELPQQKPQPASTEWSRAYIMSKLRSCIPFLKKYTPMCFGICGIFALGFYMGKMQLLGK